MAIKGHKDRAMLRRGINEQESLKRRGNLNESATLRRSLIEQEPTEEEDMIKLHNLCGEDVGNGITDSVYCSLINILEELPELLRIETHQAINDIYDFFKQPLKKDNRSLFRKTIKAILKNENPSHALRLISKFLKNPEFDREGVKRALLDFRHSEGSVPQDQLEDFLKKARFMEYSNFENSFTGDNFELVRGRLSFGSGFEDPFPMVVYNVFTKKYDINTVIQTVAQTVLEVDITELLNKADLKLKNDLKVGDEIIIPKGGSIEVKKMDYELDSYFSEFYAIYKSKLPDIAYTPEYIAVYNQIIDGVFKIVKEKGQHLIDAVTSGFDAIVYDGNLIILKDNIHLYWSNKGQRGCNERRLSIRFKLKNSEIKAYIYNSKTHSNQLIPQDIAVHVNPEIICN